MSLVEGVQVVDIYEYFYLIFIAFIYYFLFITTLFIAKYPDVSGTPSKVVPVFGFPSCSEVPPTCSGSVHVLFNSQYLNT